MRARAKFIPRLGEEERPDEESLRFARVAISRTLDSFDSPIKPAPGHCLYCVHFPSAALRTARSLD